MLTMSEINCIKFLRNEKSYSINSVLCQMLGFNGYRAVAWWPLIPGMNESFMPGING